MILAQGWKRLPDGRQVVRALSMRQSTNGFKGVELHVGEYDPDAGQTIDDVVWTFRCATYAPDQILQYDIPREMMTWIDSQAQVTELLAYLDEYRKLLAQMADHIRNLTSERPSA